MEKQTLLCATAARWDGPSARRAGSNSTWTRTLTAPAPLVTTVTSLRPLTSASMFSLTAVTLFSRAMYTCAKPSCIYTG